MIAKGSTGGKVWSVVEGKDVNFMKSVEGGSPRKRTGSDLGKERFRSRIAVLFNGLGQGVYEQDRGIDIEHLSGPCPFLCWFLTGGLQSFLMRQDALQTLFSSSM